MTGARKLGLSGVLLSLFAACGPVARAPAPADPARVDPGPTGEPVHAAAADAGLPPPVAAPDVTLYTLREAIADVMASPLAFIGTGEWTGVTPYPPCAYRNDRVIVLDNYCTTRKEISTFGIDVYSPTRGWVEIYATAKDKRPVSKTPRSQYGSFIVTSGPVPAPGKVEMELTFDMTYQEVERYEGVRAGAGIPSCWQGVHAEPASGCNQEMPAGVGRAFRAEHEAFMKDPPELWYEFARHIIAQRRHPWPKPENFEGTPEYLSGRAIDWARQHGLQLMQFQWKNVGNRKGWFVPVSATPDDGFIVIGNQVVANGVPNTSGEPVVLRVDKASDVVWACSLLRSDFFDFEAASFVPTPDGGVIAHVLAYKGEGSGPTNRLVKIDSKGSIVWDWIGRGTGGANSPVAGTLQLTRKGVIHMTGHVYLDGGDVEYAWTGDVDATTGKLVTDKVGARNPYKRKP